MKEPTGEDEVAQRAIEQLLTQLPTSTPDEFSAQAASRQPWAEVAAPSTKGKVTLETFLADFQARLQETPALPVTLPEPTPAQLYMDALLAAPKSRKKKRKKGKRQEPSGLATGTREAVLSAPSAGPPRRNPPSRTPGRAGRPRPVPGEPLFAEPYTPPTGTGRTAEPAASPGPPHTEGLSRSAKRRRRKRGNPAGTPRPDLQPPSRTATQDSGSPTTSPPSPPS